MAAAIQLIKSTIAIISALYTGANKQINLGELLNHVQNTSNA